jgi:mannose-1-phosphate guanylyltransferase
MPEREGVERAMVLAAGLGTRLRPLTDRLAKPLLPILGRPLLGTILDRLIAAGAGAIAVNTHHRAEDVRELVTGSEHAPRVTLFHEPEILGTGGGPANARGLLAEGDRFLLHNGDVLCDADLGALIADHRASGAAGTLLLTDWPEVNTVVTDPEGRVLRIGRGGAPPAIEVRRLTYTGIAVFERGFLDYVPEGPSSLVDALRRAMAEQPGSVRGFAPGGFLWSDLGTLTRYLDAHRGLLGGRRSGETGGARVHLAEASAIDAGARVEGFAVLGHRARIESGARVRDVVLLDGATVPEGTAVARAVIGPDWSVTEEENERERLILAAEHVLAERRHSEEVLSVAGRSERILGHGSDRAFRRIEDGRVSAVLMTVPPEDPEFHRFVAVGRFLSRQGFGGPRILAADPGRRFVLMEDLGRDSLHEAVTHRVAADDAGARRDLYCRVLDRLVDLQVRGTRLVDEGECPEAGDRLMDHDTLRWETDYFRRRFLADVVGLPGDELDLLDEEFERLAAAALEQPVVLMHRDFQSQNILLHGDEVRLVDFQGMRRGPLLYDVMSLLRDAYVDLGKALRAELLEHYRLALAAAGGPSVDRPTLARMAATAGLQRNMQALGAFGFLSLVKGKSRFREHVPLGLRHLGEDLIEASAGGLDLPRLAAVVREIPTG